MRAVLEILFVGISILLLESTVGWADDNPVAIQDESLRTEAEDEMITQTFGGRQFWGDVFSFRSWRIQQNVFTKHYRLIDPKDVRHAFGSFERCQTRLQRIRDEQNLSSATGAAVVLVHGLMQSSKCMSDMGRSLRESGYTTIEFDYPSTQISIPQAAQYLDRLVRSLDGFEELNFVVHSMGGLVVRAYGKEYDDPRIKRMVMLGTPNLGAELADITQRSWIVRAAAGPGARQLGTRPDGLIPKLPVPRFEFAVIAGARGTTYGWNPLIPGDDDGTVTVASTRLVGASDFATVRSIHSRLLLNEDAITQTVNFLKSGRLRPDGDSQPILNEEFEPLEVPLFEEAALR